ncbi:hypothetical protein HHI36_012780 [Cryptolaemus montrouzieri]|uniref:Uncharacterized protein n=1 Tax=Cryptolaemus montrouzieri TaxID=559131 RepID=A0ABD2NFF1_9CUCU
MAYNKEALIRELTEINKEKISIIINKSVPENVEISEELRQFLESKESEISGKLVKSRVFTELNLQTNIDNIRLESDLKVFKMQLDCVMETIGHLKKSVSDKELIINILTHNEQTGKSSYQKCEVVTFDKKSLNEGTFKLVYTEITACNITETDKAEAKEADPIASRYKRKPRKEIIVGSDSEEPTGHDVFKVIPKRAIIHVLNTRAEDIHTYVKAKFKSEYLKIVACPTREGAKSLSFRIEADIDIS